jgi:hypothetical protein
MFKKILKRLTRKQTSEDYSPIHYGLKGSFIFIHINKTGGTSIASAVGVLKKQHLTAREIIEIVGEDYFKNTFVFSAIRNPWSKVVSHYKYRVKTNQTNMKEYPVSFKDWVTLTLQEQDPRYYDNPKMFQQQVDWLIDKNGEIAVNDLIRFESINSDFKRISEKIGINNALPHLNQTRKEDYRKYYDSESIEIVGRWFHLDILKFNYSFDG